jgi:hypothetical protein
MAVQSSVELYCDLNVKFNNFEHSPVTVDKETLRRSDMVRGPGKYFLVHIYTETREILVSLYPLFDVWTARFRNGPDREGMMT